MKTSDPPESVSVTIVTENSKNTTRPAPAPAPAPPASESAPPPPSPVKEDQNMEKDEPKPSKMKRVIFPITLLSFLLSIPILFVVVWLSYVRSFNCEDIIKLPRIQLGIIIGLVVVFILSNLVAYFGSRLPLVGLLVVMFPLLMMFAAGLTLIGASGKESTNIHGAPLWIKMQVINEHNWNNIKSCIYQSRTCDDLISRSYSLKPYDFTASKLTQIEYGCCKPPSSCEMEFVNATYWRGGVVMDGNEQYDNDCNMWENEESSLCYHCYSCKLGFLKTLQGKWWKLGVFLVVMSLLLFVVHVLLFIFSLCDSHR